MKASANNSLEEVSESIKKDVNPYVQILIEAQQTNSLPLMYGPALKNQMNKWHTYFDYRNSENADIILEIGCHKGKVLSEMAQNETEKCFLGLDITFKRVVLSSQKLKREKIDNAGVLMANARHLDQFIASDELSGIVIFFPDPWTKKARQQHNRLIDSQFCHMIKKLLKKNSFFWFKTDSLEYFELASAYLKEAGFKLYDNLFLPMSRDYTSTFESNFHAKGIRTYSSCWYNAK